MSPIKRKDKGDHVSHKVIEKRRRDRINNCLAELSQSVPAAFTKQSAGKLEKAEILEMTVDYLRAINSLNFSMENGDWLPPNCPSPIAELQRHFTIGYGECLREVLRYVTEVEGFQVGDIRCTRMIGYLQNKGADLLESIGGSSSSDGRRMTSSSGHRQQSTYVQWSSVLPYCPLRPDLCCCQSSSAFMAAAASATTSKAISCLACPPPPPPPTTPLDATAGSKISYENVYNNYYHNLTFAFQDHNRHKVS